MNSFTRVLAACSLRAEAARVIESASELAAKHGAELHLLHVLERNEHDPEDAALHVREKLESLLPPETMMALTVRCEVRHGSLAKRVAEYVHEREIDLLVVGKRHRNGLANILSSDLATHLLSAPPCLLLIVPLDAKGVSLDAHADATISVVERPPGTNSPALDLLQRALALRATDVHIDPSGDGDYEVRMRIDGRLEVYCQLDTDVANHLIHQFKILAQQDIADPFHPHEGRLRLPARGWDCQARLTTSPVAGGEAVCLRLLSNDSMRRTLDNLGLSASPRAAILEILQRGEGMVLVTGPTGAGKTTTVYAMLRELEHERPHLNVATIEDPVEFTAPFLRQLSVDQQHGFTMAQGLRTMLRMDPDVVFVGEIRDAETAETSMRASSSGKYVLSTLHTRDVAGSLTALRDLGISNWSLSANVTGVISQRLVRRLCERCRCSHPIDDRDRELFQQHGIAPPEALFEPVGCEHCRQRGYVGRTGVFEAAVTNLDLAAAVSRGVSEEELRQLLRSTGTLSLTADGLKKVADGITSMAEVRQMHWL